MTRFSPNISIFPGSINPPVLYTLSFLIIKSNVMHYFSALFGKELYMFRIHLLSIIRSFNTVFTAIAICHNSFVD